MYFRVPSAQVKHVISYLEKCKVIPLIDYIFPIQEAHTHVAKTIIHSIKTFPHAYHYISLSNLGHDSVSICAILATAQCTNTNIVIHEEPTESKLNPSLFINYIQKTFPDSSIYCTYVMKNTESRIKLLEDIIHPQTKLNVNLVSHDFFEHSNHASNKEPCEFYSAAAKTLLQSRSKIILSSTNLHKFNDSRISFPFKVMTCSPYTIPLRPYKLHNLYALQYLPVTIESSVQKKNQKLFDRKLDLVYI
jgi:hypothetical protein